MPDDRESGHPEVRAAEVIGSLCLATDLGTGLPLEHGLRSTLVTMRLAQRVGVDAASASQAYYACLLFYIGCTADADIVVELFEDGALARIQDPAGALVVVHDEPDLPFGGLRIKLGGGDDGHNGLKSIRRSLGSGESNRVRFGIGRPPGRMDAAAFVLRDFGAAQRKELDLEVDRSADAVEALVTEGLERAQNAFKT